MDGRAQAIAIRSIRKCDLTCENAAIEERVFSRDAGLLQRIVTWSQFRNKSPMEVMALLRKRGPQDVLERAHRLGREFSQ
ncbi:MAG: hypothetical protein Q7T07_15785 [Burkholderiaceae bacterium]|nr:hypothetical protein [Burkholderiaceae bacterium]